MKAGKPVQASFFGQLWLAEESIGSRISPLLAKRAEYDVRRIVERVVWDRVMSPLDMRLKGYGFGI